MFGKEVRNYKGCFIHPWQNYKSYKNVLMFAFTGWYPPIHGWGAATYNWNCGSEFYDTSGCDGESEYAVNNMPDSVEMIYSDIGDEVYFHAKNTC